MRWPGGMARAGSRVREPAVAGRFYAGDPQRLAAEVDAHVAQARLALARQRRAEDGSPWAPERLVAVVAPHAGHIYSGPTAGFAYATIDPAVVRRVVLLGPAHFVAIDGIGTSSAAAWRTPLGEVPIDGDLTADLRAHFDSVAPGDDAHAPEHSLEVQLPFLQRVLEPGWTLVPLIVGADLPDETATVIVRCAALPDTLVVVSTDLSHYLDHESAIARDERTIAAVLQRSAAGIGPHDACGRFPLRGLLVAAAANDWDVELLDARNSGDTAGDWDRVVGYAAFAVTGPAVQATSEAPDVAVVAPPEGFTVAQREALLGLARHTISEALASGRRPSLDPDGWEPALREPGAAFVTLRSSDGELLGCIGSLAAYRPLVVDVAEHAYDAAFRDPRFAPLTPERAAGMVIDISVLTPARPFPCGSYDELVRSAPVGRGLTVTAGRHRATFLPAVWEQLPERAAFVSALWRKAGMAPRAWPPGLELEVYDSEEFAEGEVPG
ncbi:MAG TPA: AmmeMemoRadiSam system protein B [Candidatus Nanopelagicales bacterium]